MDKTDRKAIYGSIMFGITIAILFSPNLGSVPTSGYSTYSSTHYQYIGHDYQWCTDQSWFVTNGYIFAEDASVDQRIFNPLFYYKGIQGHAVTYESPGDTYWKIATKVAFGFFFFTNFHSMTAKCYASGTAYWYDSWQ